MNRSFRIILTLFLVLAGVLAWVLLPQRPGNRTTVAAYKARLRAQGEKLSFEEMGFPRQPDTNNALADFLVGVNALPKGRFRPGDLELMTFSAPGRAIPAWRAATPAMRKWSGSATDPPAWDELGSIFSAASEALADIRFALREPPRTFLTNPANFANGPRYPFVQERTAAQWLAADVVVALHDGQLARAQEDLHALTQVAQFFKDDYTLVAQMIRVAVSGLALSATWEALQFHGWDEAGLAALQQDLEGLDLPDAFERGMLGERAFGEWGFAFARTNRSSQVLKTLGLGMPPAGSPRKPEDYLREWVLVPFWRANMDADELFFLEHHQRCLDSIRRLRHGAAWAAVEAEFRSHHAAMEGRFANRFGRYRYLLSAVAIPNSSRAALAMCRTETQRRLTLAALAIERYRLQNGQPPSALSVLVPQFLSALPVDPMSGRPLGYKPEHDGGLSLYSTGEDSRDDGGDATSATPTESFGLWSGNDAVWPKAAFPPPAPRW